MFLLNVPILRSGWQFSTRGLSAICKEGPDAILSALRELENYGYLVRHQARDEKGRISNMVFEIYEKPQEVLPERVIRIRKIPMRIIRCGETVYGKSRTQKYGSSNTEKTNTSLNNYQSINLDGMDRMDEREVINSGENLELDILAHDTRLIWTG